MKRPLTVLENVPQSVEVALVSIQIASHWKLNVLMYTRTPLTESGVQLINYVSIIGLNGNNTYLPPLQPKRPSEWGLHDEPVHRHLGVAGNGLQTFQQRWLVTQRNTSHGWSWWSNRCDTAASASRVRPPDPTIMSADSLIPMSDLHGDRSGMCNYS